jgi:hypothetical protein
MEGHHEQFIVGRGKRRLFEQTSGASAAREIGDGCALILRALVQLAVSQLHGDNPCFR